METLELFANRFVVTPDRHAIDLASGEEVVLLTSSSGGSTDETRWGMRCDRFFSLRHRAIAELVDYGAVGERRRFEAWRCRSPWRGSPDDGRRVLGGARSFLEASGLTAEDLCERSVRESGSQAVVLPEPATGFPAGTTGAPPPRDLEACGLRLIERRSVSAIAELFDSSAGGLPRIVALASAAGGGLETAVTVLARQARLHGFVPLSGSIDNRDVLHLLHGRSLFALIDGSQLRRSWRRALDRIVDSPCGHVLLFVGAGAVPSVHTLKLERLAPEVLVDAVQPGHLDAAHRRRLEWAARRARGRPGRFAALVWGAERPARRIPPGPSLVAAERSAVYGGETGSVFEPSGPVEPRGWPSPRELASLKRKWEAAVTLVKAGRHAPGERALRAAVAGLARRRAWHEAAQGALALVASLLRRGQARLAQQVLGEARDYCRQAGVDGAMLDLAVLSGVAWTDLGRLDEAESVFSASLTACGSTGEPTHQSEIRLALARCLFWRGRYDEGARVLAPVDDRRLPDGAALRRSIVLSRLAIGSRELEVGVSGALGARQAAERTGDAGLIAEATYGVAFARLAVGDHAAVDRDLEACIRAARAARDPLRAVRARLLAAENDRRQGRPAAAAALVGRLGRMPGGSLPVTVRARSALLADLLSTASDADTVKRHVSATGLPALALYAPQPAAAGSDARTAASEVVDILKICQMVSDDREVLKAVCALLRGQLHASTVAFFASERGSVIPLVCDGSSRLEPEMAARAIAAGQALPPHVRLNVLEGGAPVRFGGETVGALVGRWTLGASLDPGRAALLLSTAATAAGAAMSGVLARRAAPPPRGDSELLGVSPAMEEVRRSIERAAAAPFAVLVEGESGSGKELVARALHRRSSRKDRPFCTLNCAALPDDLVEAELFGHARGAFTGAIAERTGVFEEAHTGTLFLDEIGELAPRAQAKILRTIQEGEVRRVGENIARRVDVRIVSATNRDLRREAASGRFRLDLLFRLDVVRISLPPLRDRREDIAMLVDRFWREAIDRVGSRAALSAATLAALARYDWPGNVREVQNVLASLAVRSPRRGVVPPTALPAAFDAGGPSASFGLEAARRTFDEQFIRAALVRTGGHRARAADELGVTRQGLTKLMTRLGITGLSTSE